VQDLIELEQEGERLDQTAEEMEGRIHEWVDRTTWQKNQIPARGAC
jgi:hypothetical protein